MSWLNPPATLTTVPVLPASSPDIGGNQPFNLALWVSIDMIREHTKTEDVPSVSDAQLALYRDAAIEACEQYTGFLLREQRSITEPVERKFNARTMQRGYFTHQTRYPVVDGIVYLFGPNGRRVINIIPGTTKVRVPVVTVMLDVSSSCCAGPCDGNGLNSGMKLLYRAGFKRCADGTPEGVPAGLKLGVLKYIAWSITHPGDMLLTVRNRESSDEGLVRGTNNAAWASGALELWRQYDPEAI